VRPVHVPLSPSDLLSKICTPRSQEAIPAAGRPHDGCCPAVENTCPEQCVPVFGTWELLAEKEAPVRELVVEEAPKRVRNPCPVSRSADWTQLVPGPVAEEAENRKSMDDVSLQRNDREESSVRPPAGDDALRALAPETAPPG